MMRGAGAGVYCEVSGTCISGTSFSVSLFCSFFFTLSISLTELSLWFYVNHPIVASFYAFATSN